MCVCISVCAFLNVCLCVYVYVSVSLCVLCVCVCSYCIYVVVCMFEYVPFVSLCMCVYVYIFLCMSLYASVSMYLHVCLHVFLCESVYFPYIHMSYMYITTYQRLSWQNTKSLCSKPFARGSGKFLGHDSLESPCGVTKKKAWTHQPTNKSAAEARRVHHVKDGVRADTRISERNMKEQACGRQRWRPRLS